eukprot:CAMPEP_0172937722 /NCGR_PEP_ID=MMETSP1075-20121228/222663_1 /TAXON_ID=2916 /ORGANISM="Ceratium fusus, Strain PA161109" /LENGTH=57 /DNA_ID=CAMNT_0013799099 /DNA_START=1783 /DNA_END=1956 /DNA_ORIENTATION=-
MNWDLVCQGPMAVTTEPITKWNWCRFMKLAEPMSQVNVSFFCLRSQSVKPPACVATT